MTLSYRNAAIATVGVVLLYVASCAIYVIGHASIAIAVLFVDIVFGNILVLSDHSPKDVPLLKGLLPHKEIGWTAIGEEFTRYQLLKSPWFNIYLHELYAPEWHPECHNHPWSFITLLLWNGYEEQIGDKTYRRRPGSILYRPAEFLHNVVTPWGTSWSLVITARKTRAWGFESCRKADRTI